MTCRKSKFSNITLLVISCISGYSQMFFSHFYTPTSAVFRKMSDRFRLSQNFEKRDFIMFPLTVLVSKPPNVIYSNCHFIKDFEENYLVLPFLWLSRMYLMLVKRWFVFVKYVRHNDGAKLDLNSRLRNRDLTVFESRDTLAVKSRQQMGAEIKRNVFSFIVHQPLSVQKF